MQNDVSISKAVEIIYINSKMIVNNENTGDRIHVYIDRYIHTHTSACMHMHIHRNHLTLRQETAPPKKIP